MSIDGFIGTFILTIITLIVVLRPFVMRRKRIMIPLDRQHERALLYYERILTNIRDLDEDQQTGKIAADEYEAEREFWMGRGIQIRKLIEQLQDDQAIITHVSDADDLDAAIDHAIDDYLQTSIAAEDADAEDADADAEDADAEDANTVIQSDGIEAT